MKSKYAIERRAAWRIRLLDSSTAGTGMTLAQQQMEKLLLRAKTQLKHSKKMRAGHTRQYNDTLHGGASFVPQWRDQVKNATDERNARCCDQQEERLAHLDQHLDAKCNELGITPRASSAMPENGSMEDSVQAVQSLEANVPSTDEIAETSPREICSLCRSSSIHYNLCCAMHDVLHRIGDNRNDVRPASTAEDHISSRTHTASSEESERDDVPCTEQDRIRDLFVKQDQQLQHILQFQQKELQADLEQQRQARVALSPVATHFRDRVKHIGVLAEQHQQQEASRLEQHGIGGHFLQLQAQLKREASVQNMDTIINDDGKNSAACLNNSLVSTPLSLNNATGCTALSTSAPRMFPNAQEMELLAPIDTPALLTLYLHNNAAIAEMLDGFIDIVQTHILPNLQSALDSQNRSALVEFLDFAARAAEFVCGRRVQVSVAQLLHEIAISSVGDFSRFRPWFDRLMKEFENTMAFAQYYRQQIGAKHKKKRA